MSKLPSNTCTICPGSSDPILYGKLLYKTGDYFLDIQHHTAQDPCCPVVLLSVPDLGLVMAVQLPQPLQLCTMALVLDGNSAIGVHA